jgi:hypothetical protein
MEKKGLCLLAEEVRVGGVHEHVHGPTRAAAAWPHTLALARSESKSERRSTQARASEGGGSHASSNPSPGEVGEERRHDWVRGA